MPGAAGTDSPAFNAVNRGKRSIVLNLKPPRGATSSRGSRGRLNNRNRELSSRCDDVAGPGLRGALGGQPAAHLRVHLGVRPDRPQRGKGGFRSDRAGRGGDHVDYRRAGRTAGQGGHPVTDLGAGLFALVGILAALEHRHRSGAGQLIVPRWWTRASRSRCGSPRSTSRNRRAGGAGVGAPDERALSGDSAAPTATSRSAPPTSGCSGGCARCSAHGVGRRGGVRDNASRVRKSRRPGGADRVDHRRPAVRALAGAARRERHPVRSDQRLRAGVRRSAGACARDGRRDEPPGARHIRTLARRSK